MASPRAVRLAVRFVAPGLMALALLPGCGRGSAETHASKSHPPAPGQDMKQEQTPPAELAQVPAPAERAKAEQPSNAQATPDSAAARDESTDNPWGRIHIDGSSTVYPITDAAAREFKKVHPQVWIRVDLSGSLRGITKLLAGQIPIADASRKINEKEIAKAAEEGISFIELPVALDGIPVVVSPANTWVDSLTVAELKRIYEPDSKINLWSDLRADWPAEQIEPVSPPLESGTFDYFTTAICGKFGAIRKDHLATWAPSQPFFVSEHKGAIGFFGYSWYATNHEKLKLVPIRLDENAAAIAPSEETIRKGTYVPLSRPIFIYVNAAAATHPEVDAFVRFYLQNAATFVKQAGYIPLPAEAYKVLLRRFDDRKAGSPLRGKSEVGLSLDDLLMDPASAQSSAQGT